jgi:hypothetical protein
MQNLQNKRGTTIAGATEPSDALVIDPDGSRRVQTQVILVIDFEEL